MLNSKTKILLFGAGFWWFGEGMLGPLFAVFTQRVGGNVLDITWAWATYLLITGVAMIVVGKISDDKVDKEKLMLLGYILNAVFTFSYLLVNSTAALFVVQAGLGIAVALAGPTWSALYAKYEDKKHDGLTWALADADFRFTTGLAIIIGGLIVSYFSFQALFIIMGIIQTLATIQQARILRG